MTPRPGAAAVAPLLLGAMVGSLVATRLESAALCALAALAGAAALGAPTLRVGTPRPSARWTFALLASSAVAFALNVWLTPGTRLTGLPVILGRAATREGVEVGALLLTRMVGALAAVQGLRRAWPGTRAADAAARALAPLERARVPVREGRAVLGLALRFAPLLREEAVRIGRVQALRLGRPARGAGERLALLRAAAIPTLVGSLERAERVALALEARHDARRPPGVAEPAGAAPAGRVAWTLAGLGLVAVALLWRG
jgi:energy-coupling factor transporter transmembrane protein EcfT